jgi:hypothetical protein
MVRPNRIKELKFAAFTVTGSVKTATYSNHSINGEILKVTAESVSSPGSVWFAESGTDIEFYRRNNYSSGTTPQDAYVFVYPVNSANATGSPQVFTKYVTNSPIYFAASGLTSGTDKSFGPLTVYYR